MNKKSIFKKAYSIIPFKKQLFTCIKYFFKPKQALYKHLHFKGQIEVEIDKTNSFKMFHTGNVEENEIFWNGLYGGWEKKSVALWTKLCINADVILDIGANTGLYSLVAAKINPAARIWAFEPITGVYSILEKNISINKFNIESHQVALSNYTGTGNIYIEKGAVFAYSVTVNKNTISTIESDEIEIKVSQLSQLIENKHINRIDLMKIDVETHEFEVLQGMGAYLYEFTPTLLIEILNDEVAKNVNSLLNSIDYLYFNIDDENNSIRQTDKLSKSDHWNFLVCSKEVAKSLELI